MPDMLEAYGWDEFCDPIESLTLSVSANGDPAGDLGPISPSVTAIEFPAPNQGSTEYTAQIRGLTQPRACSVRVPGGSGNGGGG